MTPAIRTQSRSSFRRGLELTLIDCEYAQIPTLMPILSSLFTQRSRWVRDYVHKSDASDVPTVRRHLNDIQHHCFLKTEEIDEGTRLEEPLRNAYKSLRVIRTHHQDSFCFCYQWSAYTTCLTARACMLSWFRHCLAFYRMLPYSVRCFGSGQYVSVSCRICLGWKETELSWAGSL